LFVSIEDVKSPIRDHTQPNKNPNKIRKSKYGTPFITNIIPERIQIEFRIKAIASGVSGESARIPQYKIVTAIIPAITIPPDKATEKHLVNAYFFIPTLLTIDLIYPELKSSQKLSANGNAQKMAANGEKELIANGTLKI
jgi:hypothetical protein